MIKNQKKINNKKKKKWVSPKLVILKENSYHSETISKVYAQYTGGGGTVYHSTDHGSESVYNDCM